MPEFWDDGEYNGRAVGGVKFKFDNGWTVSYSKLDGNVWAWDSKGRNDTANPMYLSDGQIAAYMAVIAGKEA